MFKLLVGILLLFLAMPCYADTAVYGGDSPNVSYRTWQALATLVVDDGYDTVMTYMYPVSVSKNVPMVLAVITNVVGTAGYVTWAQIATLAAAGWEIASHTDTHPNLTELIAEQMDTEFDTSKTKLQAQGYTPKNVIYPSGYQNSTVQTEAFKYYRSGRGTTQTYNSMPLTALTSRMNLNAYHCQTLASEDTYKTYIDNAYYNQQWLILYNHGGNADQQTLYENLIDYIKGKNISIVTIDQALDIIYGGAY